MSGFGMRSSFLDSYKENLKFLQKKNRFKHNKRDYLDAKTRKGLMFENNLSQTQKEQLKASLIKKRKSSIIQLLIVLSFLFSGIAGIIIVLTKFI